MDRGQPLAQLAGDGRRLVLWQPPDPTQQGGQILSVDVLHRQERLPIRLADVVDTANVGVAHPAGGRHLLAEAGQSIRVSRQVGGQELQGHRLTEGQVGGAIHLAHAPLAQRRHDPVAAGQDIAGGEARGGGAGGR